jgi:hypothetical protein
MKEGLCEGLSLAASRGQAATATVERSSSPTPAPLSPPGRGKVPSALTNAREGPEPSPGAAVKLPPLALERGVPRVGLPNLGVPAQTGWGGAGGGAGGGGC